ncbi:MAG TPA: hypothetical protein PK420_12485, partial [Rubrivivax sp.]|nr:hypothetical protein [Rubrivivax sp.]
MDAARPAVSPAELARGALRRLARAHLEPTPENFARAYAAESGHPAPAPEARDQGPAWVALIEQLTCNLERGSRQWTGARRKESVRRVLDSSRSDAPRLLHRLHMLMAAWENDQPSNPMDTGTDDPPLEAPAAGAGADAAAAWLPLVKGFEAVVRASLPSDEPRAAELAPAEKVTKTSRPSYRNSAS